VVPVETIAIMTLLSMAVDNHLIAVIVCVWIFSTTIPIAEDVVSLVQHHHKPVQVEHAFH
jgi:hypothetical protein